MKNNNDKSFNINKYVIKMNFTENMGEKNALSYTSTNSLMSG